MGTPPEPTGPDSTSEEEESPAGELSLTRIEVVNLILVGAASAGALWISRQFALGVLAGGLLMAANFRVIAGVMRAVFLRGSASLVNVGLYWVKFVAVMFLAGALILFFRVDAIGFLIGLSVILVAITAEALVRLVAK